MHSIVARKCEKSFHEKLRYKGVTQPEIHKVQMFVNKKKIDYGMHPRFAMLVSQTLNCVISYLLKQNK